jgi:hypothetical protein
MAMALPLVSMTMVVLMEDMGHLAGDMINVGHVKKCFVFHIIITRNAYN